MERSDGSGKSGTAVADMASLSGKYLTFKLVAETYGLEILKVQEIIGLLAITPVPRAPNFVRGVINLRGKVIPVVDMHSVFSLKPIEDTERTCVVVVQIVYRGGDITMGIVVDEVSEVLDIDGKLIEPPPSFGGAMKLDFILGVGKVGGNVIMLLDVDKVLSGGEIENVGNLA